MSTVPIRTSKADRNYFSLNQSSMVWFAGTPEEREEPLLPYPLHLLPGNAQAFDAILKLSGRTDTHLTGLQVAQGSENAVDMNNGVHDCSLEGRFGVGGRNGDQVITIKGGSHHIALKGTVESHGEKSTVVLGCWSDQSRETTHHVDLSLLRVATGEPFTVILGRVNAPLRSILFGRSPDIALPPGARILKLASLGEWSYWWAKRFYVLARYRRW